MVSEGDIDKVVMVDRPKRRHQEQSKQENEESEEVDDDSTDNRGHVNQFMTSSSVGILQVVIVIEAAYSNV